MSGIFGLDKIGGALISGGLNFLGARDANKRSQNQYDSNYKLSRDQLYNGYSIAARDLKNAGINSILAGKWGPASTSTPAMSNFQNTGQAFTEGYNTMSTAQKTHSQTGLIETQDKLAENLEEVSSIALKVFKNTGKHLTDLLSKADWKTIGTAIGEALAVPVHNVIKALQEKYKTWKDLIGNKNPSELPPEEHKLWEP